jgi:hypothetical protein
LEELAKTNKRSLGADDDDENFEYASDIDEDYPRVTISNITPSKVAEYSDDASDIAEEVHIEVQKTQAVEAPVTSKKEDYTDLPF